jgi:hypothetical protein
MKMVLLVLFLLISTGCSEKEEFRVRIIADIEFNVISIENAIVSVDGKKLSNIRIGYARLLLEKGKHKITVKKLSANGEWLYINKQDIDVQKNINLKFSLKKEATEKRRNRIAQDAIDEENARLALWNSKEVFSQAKQNLMWVDNLIEKYSVSKASAYCESLEFAQYKDWRLPNLIELSLLKDTKLETSNFKDYKIRDGISGKRYPEKVLISNKSSKDKFQSFVLKTGDTYITTYDSYVRCVRNIKDDSEKKKIIAKSFGLDNYPEDMILDDSTKLIWAYPISVCKNLKLNGFSDFRLPTEKELNFFLNKALVNSYNTICVQHLNEKEIKEKKRKSDSMKIAKSVGLKSYPKDVCIDSKTMLIWEDQKSMFDYTRTLQSGVNYCKKLNLGGIHNWRLPNVSELEVFAKGFYKECKYIGRTDKNMWSSTKVPSSYKYTNNKVVRITRGSGENFDINKFALTRCVSNSKKLNEKYQKSEKLRKKKTKERRIKEAKSVGLSIYPKDVYIDGKRKKVWEDHSKVYEYNRNFFSANNYCEKLKIGGITNWRLPTIKEIKKSGLGKKEKSSFKYMRYDNKLWVSDSDSFKSRNGKTITSHHYVGIRNNGSMYSSKSLSAENMYSVRCIRD